MRKDAISDSDILVIKRRYKMETIDFSGRCLNCHKELSKEDMINRVPVCRECLSSFVDIIKTKVRDNSKQKFSDDVDNFTDFIFSSSKLMGLEDIVLIQVCFNIYMRVVKTMAKEDVTAAKKIFGDSRRFIGTEIEKLENIDSVDNKKNVNVSSNVFGKEDINSVFDRIINMVDDNIKKGHRSRYSEKCGEEDSEKCGEEDSKKCREEDSDIKSDSTPGKRIKID